ncbi:MAG: TIGR03545 family protein [Candidatus Marinimicrobia bacterium]|nr:TIGR03545 family protein [Candidatus Neomarinimicrobiota bacterium]
MRWKGLIFIIILLVGMFILAGIFTDNWLEDKIETTTSQINGARVEIDDLDVSFLKLSLSWDKIKITDRKNTMKNLIETGACKLDLDLIPLFYRDIVIEKFQITGFQTGTEREYDGKIVRKQRKKDKQGEQKKKPGLIQKTSQQLYGKLEDYAGLRLQNVKSKVDPDSLLAAIDLQSIDYIDSLEKVYTKKYNYWQEQINTKDIRKQLENLEKDFNNIKSIDPEKIKSVKELQNTITTLQKARKDLIKIRDKVDNLSNNMESDLKDAKVASSDLRDIVERDYQKVKARARIPDLKRQNIANFIFGAEVIERINGYLDIIERIRSYYDKIAELKKQKRKKTKSERFEGQDIQYSGKYNFPKFWIKEIELSGKTQNNMELKGDIKNVVSDQNLIKAPVEIQLQGNQSDGKKLSLTAILDNRTSESEDIFKLDLDQIPLNNRTISRSQLFPYKITSGRGRIEGAVSMAENNFNGDLEFNSRALEFTRLSDKNADAKINSIIEKIVQDLDELNIKVDIKGSPEKINFDLSSNVDEIFNQKIRSIVSEEIEAARKEIENRVDKKVSQYREQVDQLLASRKSELKSEVKKYEKQLKKYEDRIDSKKQEVEDRIQKLGQDKIDDLKKKGKKALDDLF